MEANSSNLGFLLHDVARLLRKRFEQHTRGSGLTRSQWQVLAYLARCEGINQGGLAELLDIKPITLARIIDKLESLGLVERRAHPSDKRIWLLHLTPAAHPKMTQLRKLGDLTRKEALTQVSESDQQDLSRILQVLKTNLTDACRAPVVARKRENHG